jgi:hypothetical protein
MDDPEGTPRLEHAGMTTSVVYVFDNQLFNNHEIKEYMMLKQIFFKIIFHSKSYGTINFNYKIVKIKIIRI